VRLRHVVGGVLILALAGAAGFAVLAYEPAIDPVTPPERSAFEAATIARGAELAAIGNCIVCHTAPGGAVLAGGLAIATPFGTIHSTNITPDLETGIGRWSEAAFARSMRRGVDRDGRHLYPAFPYDHFTRVSDADNRALYAYLMTRQPVRAPERPNELAFPFNLRPLLAGWKLLFLREGPQADDAAQSAEWNQGAYLAEGLAHCGACHTPRNRLGAEKRDEHFAGGEAEGWYAYALNAASPAPVPWTADSLHIYLRQGWHAQHGISRGPMAPVTTNLASVPEADVRAMAVYVAERMGAPGRDKTARAEAVLARARPSRPGAETATGDSQTLPEAPGSGSGRALYAAACAGCHDGSRPLPYGGLNLHLSTAVNGPNPDNIINVVLQGLPPAPGERSAIMPGYDGVISDAQLAVLLAYMRAAFSDQPPWPDLPATVARQRERARSTRIYATDGGQAAPAVPTPRGTSW
jgi:mono/diheme cytochrome c family protein